MDPQFQLSPIQTSPQLQADHETNKRSIEINNLFNKLIAYNYNSKFRENNQVEQDLTKFFDILLWCQKKCPALVYQLFDMMALQQIQDVHLQNYLPIFFKNYILVMCNCKEGGLLSQLLLDSKLPHLMLQAYLGNQKTRQQEDQLVQYIGSYLKCYHRIFKPEWLNKFIVSQDYFQLLQITFKFFKCPQPLTRTSVFNIVLDILSRQQVQNFIMHNKTRYKFYQNMAEMMTISIKNQLIEFGWKIQEMEASQNSNDKFNQVISCIQDKISLWEDISRTCKNIGELFHIPFCKNVILPLLVGPLKLNSKPLFTIKYSLFILRKLMKTVLNFGLIQVLIRMIFVEEQVFYWQSQLEYVKIQPFNILTILNNHIEQSQEEIKKDFGAGIKKFFQNILRSKDNHFILMTTTLINSLYQCIKQNPKLCNMYGFVQNGKIHNQLCQKLNNQLAQTHRLVTIQSILNTLIVINQQKILPSQLQNQFIYIYKKIIEETKTSLKQKSDLWDFIVEVNQYDVYRLNLIKFGKIQDLKKFQEIYKIVFMWDIKQQEVDYFAFNSCIPDTIQDHFRYLYNKFLIIRKASAYLIQGPAPSNLMNDYCLKFVTNSPYNPGQVYQLYQIKGQTHECNIIDEKFTIPAQWIVDENFFILGFWDKSKKQVKIIMTIRYKHLTAQLKTKKDKIVISLAVRGYDYKCERLRHKNSIVVRGIQNFMHKIINFQIKARQKQMIFISGSIKKSQQELPKPSLI